MAFWDHVGELRGMLIRSGLATIPALAVVIYFSRTIFDWLLLPLQRIQESTPLYTFSPPEAIFLYLKITFVGALILSSPYWLGELVRFIQPALKRGERRLLYPVGTAGLGLFVAGLSFAYFVVLPLALKYLWEFNRFWGLEPHWRIEYYIDFALIILVVFGAAFELPLVLTVLARMGIASPAYLRHLRPYAVVAFVGFAALLTPPDVITQIMLAGPLWLLYEASIWLAVLVYPDEHPIGGGDDE